MKMVLLFISLISVAFGLSASAAQHDEYPVASPPFSEGIFPCSNCHAGLELNTQKRELKDEHSSIKLHHAEKERWCLDCHHGPDRDKLRLADGEIIDFTESYRLCGQCHGNIYRDWKAGIHGKRVGFIQGRETDLFPLRELS